MLGKIFKVAAKINALLGEEITMSNGTYKGEVDNTGGSPWRKGLGVMKYSNGQTYSGEWKNNEKSGHGALTWPSGHVYEGEFLNDEVTGKGKMKYPEGSYYIGFFVNGSREGQGVMYNSKGEIVEQGIWKNNLIVVSTLAKQAEIKDNNNIADNLPKKDKKEDIKQIVKQVKKQKEPRVLNQEKSNAKKTRNTPRKKVISKKEDDFDDFM
jgi:hypothetical protein